MKYLRKDFVNKIQDGNGRNLWHFGQNIFLKFHFRLPSHKNHDHKIVFDTHTIRIFVWITQNLFQKSGI